jgi:hypothetical protein
MLFTHWLSNRRGPSFQPASRRNTAAARRTVRPRLEYLEDRVVLSTLSVTNNLDSGKGSLRAEIAAAHSGDTIVFAPSLDGQTITLTSGELLIRKNLTIAGPGAGKLTVSGDNASRVFEVAQKENVTLSGLTISNGAAQSSDGGGILNGGTLTVTNSILSGNSAFQGGGILNGGTLTVSNSTLSGNSAFDGGGISNNETYATLTVSGSILSGNTATSLDGGGIENYGMLTVSSSTLSANTALHGGGIWNIGTATVSGSTLSDNHAGTGGGGIFDEGGTLTVINSTLSGNSASSDAGGQGGGIFNWAGALTVSGSTLSGNSADSNAGGIYNSVYGTLTVENSSNISGNSAPLGSGADVYNAGVLNWDLSSIITILDGNGTVNRI